MARKTAIVEVKREDRIGSAMIRESEIYALNSTAEARGERLAP